MQVSKSNSFGEEELKILTSSATVTNRLKQHKFTRDSSDELLKNSLSNGTTPKVTAQFTPIPTASPQQQVEFPQALLALAEKLKIPSDAIVSLQKDYEKSLQTALTPLEYEEKVFSRKQREFERNNDKEANELNLVKFQNEIAEKRKQIISQVISSFQVKLNAMARGSKPNSSSKELQYDQSKSFVLKSEDMVGISDDFSAVFSVKPVQTAPVASRKLFSELKSVLESKKTISFNEETSSSSSDASFKDAVEQIKQAEQLEEADAQVEQEIKVENILPNNAQLEKIKNEELSENTNSSDHQTLFSSVDSGFHDSSSILEASPSFLDQILNGDSTAPIILDQSGNRIIDESIDNDSVSSSSSFFLESPPPESTLAEEPSSPSKKIIMEPWIKHLERNSNDFNRSESGEKQESLPPLIIAKKEEHEKEATLKISLSASIQALANISSGKTENLESQVEKTIKASNEQGSMKWFVKIYEYGTKDYKSAVVKSDTTAKDLLIYCLSKCLGIKNDALLDEYNLYETSSKSTTDRLIPLDELLSAKLSVLNPQIEDVKFYFKKKTQQKSSSMSGGTFRQKIGEKIMKNSGLNALMKGSSAGSNSQSSHTNTEILSTFLYKFKSSGLNGWNKRFMILSKDGKKLLFFKDSTLRELFQIVDLLSITHLQAMSWEELEKCGTLPIKGGFGFEIKTKEELMQFLVPTFEQCQLLIDTIRDVSEKLKGLSGNPSLRGTSYVPSKSASITSNTSFQTTKQVEEIPNFFQKPVNSTVEELSEQELEYLKEITIAKLSKILEEQNFIQSQKLLPLFKSAKKSTLKKLMSTLSPDKKKGNDVFIRKDNHETCVFGITMENLMERLEYSGCVDLKIPPILEEIITHLEEKGLLVAGIFRVSGSKKRLESLKSQYDSGNIVNFAEYSVHDFAGLLKLYLRELPEPVFPSRLYKLLIEISKISDSILSFKLFQMLIFLLPSVNRNVLKRLLGFLTKIAENSANAEPDSDSAAVQLEDELSSLEEVEIKKSAQGNRMDAVNLSKVFGPNLIRDKQDEKVSFKNLENFSNSSKILQLLIEKEKEIWLIPNDILKMLNDKLREVHMISVKKKK